MQRLLAAIVACSLTGATLSAPEPHWTRVSTEHFVVSGDAPAADIGQVAARLESLRSVLAEMLPRAQDHSLLPAFVIVFGTDRAFKSYRPAQVTVGGYALAHKSGQNWMRSRACAIQEPIRRSRERVRFPFRSVSARQASARSGGWVSSTPLTVVALSSSPA